MLPLIRIEGNGEETGGRRKGWSRDEQEALQEPGTLEEHCGAAQGLPEWLEEEIGSRRRPERRAHEGSHGAGAFRSAGDLRERR